MSEEAPGWDAIDAALKKVYGAQEPRHWGTMLNYSLGGPDPLDGLSAYAAGDHWHYVSYGFSELYAKETEDPSTSGYGFELTFRLKGRGEPPVWPCNFLQNLARYVFKTGNVFAPGHHVNLNGPIALETTTDIVTALFAADPDLPEIETPHGRLAFVQIVGATMDEYEAACRWDTRKMLDVLRDGNPKLVTDLARASILKDPRKAKAVEDGIDRDGSSMDRSYVTQLAWSPKELTLGALAVENLVAMLRGRLGHGRDFLLVAKGLQIVLRPGTSDRAGEGILELTKEAVDGLRRTLKPTRGVYPVFPGFSIRVVPTEIKDRDGQVLRVIG